MSAVGTASTSLLYNLADFVNKIAFVLAIWVSAKAETLAKRGYEAGALLP